MEKFINKWNWVPVFDIDLNKVLMIDTKLKNSIGFFIKQDWSISKKFRRPDKTIG